MFDGQYTSADTGLVYLRARVYDSATAQFLSVDPLVSITAAPYTYGRDNPLNSGDRSGLAEGLFEGEEIHLPCYWPCGPPPIGAREAVREAANAGQQGFEDIWNAVSGDQPASVDEGENTLEEHQEVDGGCKNTPPGYDPETWTKEPASRPSNPGENFYDPEGGEWRWHAPDKYHPEGHWDYKASGKFSEWKNIYP